MSDLSLSFSVFLCFMLLDGVNCSVLQGDCSTTSYAWNVGETHKIVLRYLHQSNRIGQLSLQWKVGGMDPQLIPSSVLKHYDSCGVPNCIVCSAATVCEMCLPSYILQDNVCQQSCSGTVVGSRCYGMFYFVHFTSYQSISSSYRCCGYFQSNL